MRRTQVPQTLQWCARGGRMRWHRAQCVAPGMCVAAAASAGVTALSVRTHARKWRSVGAQSAVKSAPSAATARRGARA